MDIPFLNKGFRKYTINETELWLFFTLFFKSVSSHLKRKERKDACRGAKDKSNVKMWISSTAKLDVLVLRI